MKNKNISHGNNARINPGKNVIPLFETCATNDYITRDGTVYHMYGDNQNAAKHEVDNITKQ